MPDQPLSAQTAVAPEAAKAEDVVMSPLSDVNLMKKDIPVVLQVAVDHPYALTGIKSCNGLQTAIVDLDAALGGDIDIAHEMSDGDKMGNGAASVAKSLIGSFIPFRGVVRELSGANANERAWERAVYAGSVRRAFLKGMGEQRGCAYPARSATPQVLARLEAEREAAVKAKNAASEEQSEKTEGEPVTVSFETAPRIPQP